MKQTVDVSALRFYAINGRLIRTHTACVEYRNGFKQR